MSKSIRSLVVVGLVPTLMCCVVSQKHAAIPDRRVAESEMCFQACTGDLDCVTRCPNAESGEGACRANHEGSCVDDIDQHLTRAGIAAIIVVGIATAVGAVALGYSATNQIAGGLGADGGAK